MGCRTPQKWRFGWVWCVQPQPAADASGIYICVVLPFPRFGHSQLALRDLVHKREGPLLDCSKWEYSTQVFAPHGYDSYVSHPVCSCSLLHQTYFSRPLPLLLLATPRVPPARSTAPAPQVALRMELLRRLFWPQWPCAQHTQLHQYRRNPSIATAVHLSTLSHAQRGGGSWSPP